MGRWSLVLAVFALSTVSAGCVGLVDEDEGTVPNAEIPFYRLGRIAAQQGYVDGKIVEFYPLSTFVPADASWFAKYEKFPGMPVRELYVFAGPDGKPSVDQAQLPIVDTLPKQARSSDFFEIVLVKPPAGYQANDLKSRATLLRADYPLERTGKIVNCPAVGPDATLGPTKSGVLGEYRKLRLWYRKQLVHCMLLDGGRALIGARGAPSGRVLTTRVEAGREEQRVAAAEVYTLRSAAFSAADRVSGIPVPGNDVYRYAPGAAEYSPLTKIWEVAVPSDYQAGQLVSYKHLFPIEGFTDPRITERAPEAFCNCPIVTAPR
ncbi:MAG: hypothetical protein IT371_31600 [Deltaproteobacteria bacterium]|nr:hypothetical protein [Deltaproteobacteria bacterium]